jgi:type II secretory pathway pseudopilin PulG
MKALVRALCVVLVLISPGVFSATDADRIQQLEEQLRNQQQLLDAMQDELQRLKADVVGVEDSEQGVTVSMAPEASVSSAKAVSEATVDEASSSSAQLYGFVMADPNWNDTLRVSTIATDAGQYGQDGEFIFGVRQSRLGIKGNYGDDVTYLLEAELFGVGGDEGQTTPRLRHAWATYKNVGVGQTWSNFMDGDIFPNTIDYWGPTGMVFYRNQQARYTFPLGEDEFSIALEDPSTALTVGRFRDTNACELNTSSYDCESTGSTAADIYQAHNDVPDLSLRYRNNGDFGHYQVAAMFRELGYERLDTGAQASEFGWGVNVSAGIKTFDSDVLKLQVVYGEGIGNYMNDGGIDIAPSTDNLNTARAEAVPLLGISAYYDHYWNEQWSTSIGWSMNDLDNSAGQSGSEFAKGQIAQINLLHTPRENVMLGTEFIWGERQDVDGAKGDDYRIQFSLKVGFDSGNFLRGM